MSQHVLAIDQGTSSTKVIVVDPEGRIQGSSSAEFPQNFPQPGWVEHDPELIWSSVLSATSAALRDARISVADLATVGITNQRETVVVWERRTGLPIYNAIVWQDRRTASMCDAIRSENHDSWVQARSGVRIDPYFSATKIAWILDHVDGARSQAQHGDLASGTIDSWLLWKLTGGRVHATDATNASRTLLMGLSDVAWDDELCGLFHVPRELLPRIERSQCAYGESDSSFLGTPVPIHALLGDQQAALFAQGCVAPGQTKNTYGTGSFVLQHTGDVALVETASLIATAACTRVDQLPQYALEGSIFVTGAAIQWLRDGLSIIENVAQSESMARELDDNGDIWFVPALTGLGAPVWDSHARGVIVGLTRGTTQAHLVRAALESIAYQTRDVVDAMNAQSGHQLRELSVDGGASENQWLMQFQADILGVPVVVNATTEATALGAAYAAGQSAGVWATRHELPTSSHDGLRFEPAMSADHRDFLYGRWTRALEKAKGWAT
ncbi:MAG TPA: glycerol kinase GlpK [Acidimicrobiales bacterium]